MPLPGIRIDLLFLMFTTFPNVNFKIPYNVLQIGEVADLEALTFSLALMFI
jgi:hypothetical protein